MKVAASGGMPTGVSRLSAGEVSHRFPAFLPDGHRFLFFGMARSPAQEGVFWVAGVSRPDPPPDLGWCRCLRHTRLPADGRSGKPAYRPFRSTSSAEQCPATPSQSRRERQAARGGARFRPQRLACSPTARVEEHAPARSSSGSTVAERSPADSKAARFQYWRRTGATPCSFYARRPAFQATTCGLSTPKATPRRASRSTTRSTSARPGRLMAARSSPRIGTGRSTFSRSLQASPATSACCCRHRTTSTRSTGRRTSAICCS